MDEARKDFKYSMTWWKMVNENPKVCELAVLHVVTREGNHKGTIDNVSKVYLDVIYDNDGVCKGNILMVMNI